MSETNAVLRTWSFRRESQYTTYRVTATDLAVTANGALVFTDAVTEPGHSVVIWAQAPGDWSDLRLTSG